MGKYAVDVSAFEQLALPQLRPMPGVQLYVVDEVGKMELFSPAFFPAVQALLDAAPLVLGTLPARPMPEADAVKRRPDITLLTLTRDNRDAQAQAALAAVRQRLGGAG